jgi:hypothetical protein
MEIYFRDSPFFVPPARHGGAQDVSGTWKRENCKKHNPVKTVRSTVHKEHGDCKQLTCIADVLAFHSDLSS